jgi:hypothetical protein
MLPTEQFSGDATPDKTPWTPQVWTQGPDALVAQAQLALFKDRSDIELTALGPSTDGASMDGVNQGANEWEQVIDPSTPPEGSGGRAAIWQANIIQMRKTTELAGTVHPLDHDPSPGDANPPA